jgi:hypothetical protein
MCLELLCQEAALTGDHPGICANVEFMVGLELVEWLKW